MKLRDKLNNIESDLTLAELTVELDQVLGSDTINLTDAETYSQLGYIMGIRNAGGSYVAPPTVRTIRHSLYGHENIQPNKNGKEITLSKESVLQILLVKRMSYHRIPQLIREKVVERDDVLELLCMPTDKFKTAVASLPLIATPPTDEKEQALKTILKHLYGIESDSPKVGKILKLLK